MANPHEAPIHARRSSGAVRKTITPSPAVSAAVMIHLTPIHRRPKPYRLLRPAPVGENQNPDQKAEEEHVATHAAFAGIFGKDHRRRGPRRVLAPEEEVHEKTDDDAEHHRPHRAGDPHLHPQDARGQDDGEHVDGRAGVEKRAGRAESRSHAIDPREEGEHGARAHGEDGARHRGDGIRHELVRPRAEVAHHRTLAQEHTDRARDQERGDEAEEHVFPRVGLGEEQGLADGVGDSGGVDGKEEERQEDGGDEQEGPDFLHRAHTTVARPFDLSTASTQPKKSSTQGTRRE